MLEKELGIHIKLDKELCEPCIYGNAHRLSFGTREKASEPGELISADVCGPFDESFQKKKYLGVFKDSFTKFRYGYLIKEVYINTKAKNAIAEATLLRHPIPGAQLGLWVDASDIAIGGTLSQSSQGKWGPIVIFSIKQQKSAKVVDLR
ncbi:retrovirus-related pol polyprotein from transposon tnt 1-94 [Trichonephila clavipes]|nr:retrovirus-related pol polyprotein from transposon tnt 1-94 [Trichonephila clavipes]